MAKPIHSSYPAFYETYISKVAEDNLEEAFKSQENVISRFFNTIDEEKAGCAYAPGKWTLKELLQHLIDTERIFCYRALCFSRKETASLPGFDENTYSDNSYANERTWISLTEELKAVRKATEMLFKSFTTDMLNNSGLANNNPISVNALGFAIIGHVVHHVNIIEDRYLTHSA